MPKNNETLAAIIAEMRRRSDEAYKGQFDNHVDCVRDQIELDEIDDWAKRIETAVKREKQPGNAAAMRDALEECRDYLYDVLRDAFHDAQVAEQSGTPSMAGHEREQKLHKAVEVALSASPKPPSNAAAMCAALEGIEDDCRVLDRKDMWEEEGECYYDALRNIREKVSAALAAPARNCDVGTAEEQLARWEIFCHRNWNSGYASRGLDPCDDCELVEYGNCRCQLAWAQMPFAPAE